MAAPETARGPINQTLEARLQDVGYYRCSEPFNPTLPILEQSADGPSRLRLRDGHQHNGEVAEHVFVFDPKRIDVKVEGVDSEEEEPIRVRARKLTALKTDGYNLLITGQSFVAGWRRINPGQSPNQ